MSSAALWHPTDPRKTHPSLSVDDAAQILQHREISSVCDRRQWLKRGQLLAAGAAGLFVDDRFRNFVQGKAPTLHQKFDNLFITVVVRRHRLNP